MFVDIHLGLFVLKKVDLRKPISLIIFQKLLRFLSETSLNFVH